MSDFSINEIHRKIINYARNVSVEDNCCFEALQLYVADYSSVSCHCIINKIIHYLEDQGFNACYDDRCGEIHAFLYDVTKLAQFHENP